MMTIEKVLWTALPNGHNEDRRLRISVFVAPRLSNADGSDAVRTLGEFRAFANWPERLAAIKFVVEFDDGVSAEGIPEGAADPDLWARLLPPETPVRPYRFKDHAKRNLHVFPVRGVLGFLRQTYGALGAVGTDFPSIDSVNEPDGLLAPFKPLGWITEKIASSSSFWEELDRPKDPGKKRDGRVVVEHVPMPFLPDDQQTALNNFFQAYRFYYRPGSRRPDLLADRVEPSPEAPEFDFHQRVAHLGDHPELLRRLGLIVDLVIDLPEPYLQLPPDGCVCVVPEGELPENPPTCPHTRYELDEGWFGAKPRADLRMARGLLRLNPRFYDLFQVDVDGAALKVAGFANTLDRMLDPQRRGPATPNAIGVPALRSAGLALARTKRGEQLLFDLSDHRRKNNDIEAGRSVAFDAEDLVRGYRVDVFDEGAPDGPRWFSLHQRVVDYTVKDLQGDSPPVAFEVADEGYLKANSASGERADHPVASDDLYLHETVFGWEGWSLSAPRPGKRIGEPGGREDGSTIAYYDPEQYPEGYNPLPLVSRVSAAPRSLPRLRIGHTYRLRTRTVDLAGNSRPFSEADLEPDLVDRQPTYLATDPQTYMRFEPVPSPTVLRRHADTEGESLEHLVVRSNLGISAADYAASDEVTRAREEANSPSYLEDCQRHLAPPKTSQLMAEQHGCFYDAFGGTQDQRNAALRVALREEGTFLDRKIVDLNTGRKTIEQASISRYPPVELNEETEEAWLPEHRGDGLDRGVYAFYPDEEVRLPYLPDPLAIGVSLTGYDFTGDKVFHVVAMFEGDWPALAPFRLRLSESPEILPLLEGWEDRHAQADFSGGVLEVRLPKAEVIKARLSSVFPDGREENLAIWDWIPEEAKTDELRRAAREGRHWMLTPFRWVTFTHAVQQPLAVPNMSKVTSTRELGNTFAEFSGTISNHAKSTGRLDVFGEWSEDIDLPTDDEPRMGVQHQAHAFGFDIEPGEDPAEVRIDAGGDEAQVRTSRRVSRHEFGDTKYRRIVYHSVATTRFREFLPAPIANDPSRIQRIEPTTDAKNQEIPALVHHILSSARPAAPDVLYVLPTFRWERLDEGERRVHVRRGKAVRVWLRRPWFSSGDGELLGVVLKPGRRPPRGWRWFTPPSLEDVEKMLPSYISSWGSDPVWESELPEQMASAEDFPRHVAYAGGLTLEELPESVKVGVAAHEVYYDHQRKLWYCDIEIEPGETYFPFVRLALVRYQPHSLDNAHLSRVVMTDFIQLAPDRTAEVRLSEESAELTVAGYSGRNIVADLCSTQIRRFSDLPGFCGDESGPNTTVRVALERRIPGIPGDLGWEQVGSEITLGPSLHDFHVTWTGALDLPKALEDSSHRIVITEVETHLRDGIPGDPPLSTSRVDFVRERVVYADIFYL